MTVETKTFKNKLREYLKPNLCLNKNQTKAKKLLHEKN